LTYTWEQIDAGGVTGGTVDASEMRSDNGANPLFRSYAAVAESYRYFPALEDVLNDTVSFGEAYPTTDRELTFRITAKDSRGGVDTADVTLDVTNTGSAFAVTQPTGSTVWQGNTAQTISWNTASTQNAPINCQSVDIKADLDGDDIFDSVLISDTPNDGEQAVFSPNTITTDARVMVSCADNVFYAVNPASFRITQGSSNVVPVIDSQAVLSVNEEGSIAITLDDLQVTDPDSTYPDNFTLALQAGKNYTLENTSTVVPDANFNGELSVTVTVNDGIDDSNAFPLVVTVNPVNDAPLATNDTQTVAQESTATLINVLSNDTDIDGDTLSISDISYSGSGTVSISGEQISYQPAAGFSGNDSLSYTVSDGSTTDTGTLTITVTATPTNNTPTSGNSSGGGGSLGYFWLGLLSLTALTRRRSLPLS
ncbi:MAG: tandem-95 repeat protein, partial [Paraglaciecola chathamensis]